MSNLENILKSKNSYIGFITAGDPDIITTKKCIISLIEGGADIIEIGIPFSDPIAADTLLQTSYKRAIQNNITLNDIFNLIKSIRETYSTPVVLVTYLNPLFNYGYENFFKECKSCKTDGILIIDLPIEEKSEVDEFALKYNIDLITQPIDSDNIVKLIEKYEYNASDYVYNYVREVKQNFTG